MIRPGEFLLLPFPLSTVSESLTAFRAPFQSNPSALNTSRAPVQAARRTFAAPVNNLEVHGVRRADDLKVWAREVGAYPIIGILAFACGFCSWRMAYCAATNTDVRIVPSKRQALIRARE